MRARARKLLELLRDALTSAVTIRAVVVLGCALVGYSVSIEATEAATVLGCLVGQVIAVMLPVRRSTKQ